MQSSSIGKFALFGVVLALLAGCDKAKPKPTIEGGPATEAPLAHSVSLVLDWKPEPEFGGFYAAQAGNNFANHGLNVKISTAGAGANTWQLVASGQADFATTAADQVIIARSQGADVVALYAVYETCPQGIMVHKARGFTKLADVFDNPGTLEAEDNPWLHYCMKKFAPTKVNVINYTGGVALFLEKPDVSQQCFVTSEPLSAEAQDPKSDPQTFLISDSGYNPYTTVVITSGKTLREKPELVKSMVAACREGWQAYLANPSSANAAMGNLNPDMDAATFAKAAQVQKPLIETDETKANGLGTMTIERWKTLGQQLVELGVITKAPPAEECFVAK
ncbi:MAG TPA: ABC transporter substrate-binding protein [Tepidisphaeraceae bacterium]|jgi:NitT/TauT family transport system substrate-binding protein|nr:ABC transporter substrate-binding protein [Tepidisphaeraceae bacterium]